MKKLLFFLIGFCLAFIPVHMAYALDPTVDETCVLQYWTDNFATQESRTDYTFNEVTILPQGTSSTDANAVMLSINGTWWDYKTGHWDHFPTSCTSHDTVIGSTYIEARRTGGIGDYSLHVVIVPSIQFRAPDADGDGLPDDCDLYPDDPTPASYKMMTAAYDDATGDMIGYIVQTDRGDYDHFGDIMENPHGTPGITHEFVGNTSSWRSNDDLCAGSYTGTGNEDYDQMIEDSMTDPEPELPDEGEGQTNQEDGHDTTGTETDNEALQKIIKNTYSTNENIGNLADYLSAINTKLSVQRNENLTSSENLQQVLNQLKNETSKQLTQDQVQAAMSEALDGVDFGGDNITPAQVQSAMESALATLPDAITQQQVQDAMVAALQSDGLTEQQIQDAMGNALLSSEGLTLQEQFEAAMTSALESDDGLTFEEQIEAGMTSALQNFDPDGYWSGGTGEPGETLTQQQVQDAMTAALGTLTMPGDPLTQQQIQDAVSFALGSLDMPNDPLTQSEIQSAMTSALESIETLDDVQQSDVDTALATESQSTTAYDDALLAFNEETTLENSAPDDYKQKTDIPTFFTSLIDNNPISDIITDTRIEATGAQSYLEFQYNGQTIKLDLGGFETQLGVFGNVLLGIFTLGGFLLVFRGN